MGEVKSKEAVIKALIGMVLSVKFDLNKVNKQLQKKDYGCERFDFKKNTVKIIYSTAFDHSSKIFFNYFFFKNLELVSMEILS